MEIEEMMDKMVKMVMLDRVFKDLKETLVIPYVKR